ncbi:MULTISPECIES: hypothetical protein [unclassified Pseudoalteromonas]|uniref:hypothetical protein n=1 Tax=unclassified Pseudoalteromonas TaxID=194690 RepID=UPI002358274C|nr:MULTISPECIES: hypothetical protein [unclassified Pseudoalteromonas]MDC9502250.1 hypothetical protein [Pseudoalteromonas sp. Angola-18]MDC9527908.1 hypothetical protein [Pseudoalteromonas sp. Angola-7]
MTSLAELQNSPEKIIERLQHNDTESVHYEITVYDKFGFHASGIFKSFDENTNTISILIDKDILFFNMHFLAHILVHDANKHSNFLSGKSLLKINSDYSTINLDEKIDLLVQMLNKNYDLFSQFIIDEQLELSKLEIERISILIDHLSNNITNLAKDDFSLLQLKKINAIHIKNNSDIKFSMRESNSKIFITFSYKEDLPIGINNLIEKGFNKIL